MNAQLTGALVEHLAAFHGKTSALIHQGAINRYLVMQISCFITFY
ncbi:hypothetical protein MHH33_13185 [Paenisporosarcina sp. FSL H8-0542]